MTNQTSGADFTYARASIVLHWLMLVLMAAVYACIELRVLFERGSDVREGFKAWHFSLGLCVLAQLGIVRTLVPRKMRRHGGCAAHQLVDDAAILNLDKVEPWRA